MNVVDAVVKELLKETLDGAYGEVMSQRKPRLIIGFVIAFAVKRNVLCKPSNHSVIHVACHSGNSISRGCYKTSELCDESF